MTRFVLLLDLVPQREHREDAAIENCCRASAGERNCKRKQSSGTGGSEQNGQLHDRGDRREHRAGRRRPQELAAPGRARAHCADGGDARHEPRGKARQRQAEASTDDAHSDVTQRTHGHDQHHHDPYRARVERAVRAERLVRQQRQDDERGGGEDQPVMDLFLRQHRTHEAMDSGARRQQARHDYAEPRRQRRFVYGKAAQQCRRHQGRLGRKAGVAILGPPIGQCRQYENAHRHDREQQVAAGDYGDGATERCDGEGTDAGRCAIRPDTLAAFAIDADQQADAERDGEIEDEGTGGRHETF